MVSQSAVPSTRVLVPESLRRLTGGRPEVSAGGQTVGAILDELERFHPGLRACLLDGQVVRRFVNLYLGEEDIRFLAGLDTEVAPGSTLTILPSMAGG